MLLIKDDGTPTVVDVKPADESVRVAHPARAWDGDPARLERIVELLTEISKVVTAEGVHPILHPHIGIWVEKADKTRYVLDRADPKLLGLGPDVGRWTWAGDDSVELISEYRDRVRGVHVKDLRRAVCDESLAEDRSYDDTVVADLWIEPGRGDMDYAGLWTALGEDFDGTIVVEVGRGDIDPPFESARECAQWVASQRAA